MSKVQNLVGQKDFATDSIVFDKDINHVHVRLYVDYPTSGNPQLIYAIQEYVSEVLGGTYEGNYNQGQEMMNAYGEGEWNRLKKEYDVMAQEVESQYLEGMSFYSSYEIRKVYETEELITFATQHEIYLGGAHGMQNYSGITFRKSDGRRFGYDMMRDIYTDNFYEITKEGLKEYFSEAVGHKPSDSVLEQWLMTNDNVHALSHPIAQPYMTEEGVIFQYQPYEIAPYASGMPVFTVSYQDIMPFLMTGAKRMIKK